MAETCYSQGKKILLMPEQQPDGTWRCRFAIPGLLESTIGTSVDAPLGKYKSEWDAKTAAFALAKKAIDILFETQPAGAPGRKIWALL